MKTFKILLIMLLSLPPVYTMAEPFSPFKDLKPENSLYNNLSSEDKNISYMIYYDKNLNLSSLELKAINNRINNSFASWFTGIWDLIPMERRDEFRDLRRFLATPKIQYGGNIEKLFEKVDKELPELKSVYKTLYPYTVAESGFNAKAGSQKAALAFFIVPESTIDKICGPNALACNIEGFVLLRPDFKDNVLLHELGHVFGLADQYPAGIARNADIEITKKTLYRDSLMSAKGHSLTCDEADGVVYLFDCIMKLTSSKTRHAGWNSLCNRNVRIEACNIVRTNDFFEADRTEVILPIYDSAGLRMDMVILRNFNALPAEYNQGFNPYTDFNFIPSGITKMEFGSVGISRFRTGISKRYKVNGAFISDSFETDFEEFKNIEPRSLNTIIAMDALNKISLQSYTIENIGEKTRTFITYQGNMKMRLNFDGKKNEIFDVRGIGHSKEIRHVMFKDDRIILLQVNTKDRIVTAIHYTYDNYKPFMVEYFADKNKVEAVNVKKGRKGFSSDEKINGKNTILSQKLMDDMSDIPGSSYIVIGYYDDDAALIKNTINTRLNNTLFIRQAAEAYKNYIGAFPGQEYRNSIFKTLKSADSLKMDIGQI